MQLLRQSQTAEHIVFLLVDSTDHMTGKTGLSPTVILSKNAGAFASPAGAVTEIANGYYKLAGNATDTNTLGPLIVHATGTGADPSDTVIQVIAIDPQVAIPNAVWNEAITGHTTTGTYGAFLQPLESGTAQGGAAGTITLRAASSTTDNFYNNALVRIVAGTGAGQSRLITAYVGSTRVATVSPNWATNPDATSVFFVHPYGQVGAVPGAVGSVTGAVGSVTAGVTVTTNNDKTGYTASTVSDKTGYSLSVTPPTAAQVRTEMDSNSTRLANLDATVSSRLATAGYTAPLSAAQVNAEVDTALADYDAPTNAEMVARTLASASYATAASQTTIIGHVDGLPGVIEGKLDTALVLDGAVYQFTTNALELAPTGGAGSAPTAAEVADAVMDELLSGHTIPGSAAAALSAAGVAADPWIGEEGQAVYLGMLAIGAGSVTVSSPVTASGKVTLYSGYAHTGVLRLTFTEPEGSNWPASLVGATVHLLARTGQGSAAVTADITGEVLVATGDEKVIRFAPTAVQTAPLTATTTGHYDVYATISAVDYPLVVGGQLVVKDRIPV